MSQRIQKERFDPNSHPGLSALLMSLSYLVIFNGAEHISEFFLFWAVTLGVVFAIGACCVRPVGVSAEEGSSIRGYGRLAIGRGEFDGSSSSSRAGAGGNRDDGVLRGVFENAWFMLRQTVFWYDDCMYLLF